MKPLNWKRFKELVEAQGVTDEMEIDYMDFSYPIDSVTVTVRSSDDPSAPATFTVTD